MVGCMVYILLGDFWVKKSVGGFHVVKPSGSPKPMPSGKQVFSIHRSTPFAVYHLQLNKRYPLIVAFRVRFVALADRR